MPPASPPCLPLRSQPTQPCRAAEMDAAAAAQPLSYEQAQAEWQALLIAMKARRRHAAAQVAAVGGQRVCVIVYGYGW